MGIETFYRLNCDACDKQEETTDSRKADLKKYELSFFQNGVSVSKPYWSGWLCKKCSDGLRAKFKTIVKDMGGELAP